MDIFGDGDGVTGYYECIGINIWNGVYTGCYDLEINECNFEEQDVDGRI